MQIQKPVRSPFRNLRWGRNINARTRCFGDYFLRSSVACSFLLIASQIIPSVVWACDPGKPDAAAALSEAVADATLTGRLTDALARWQRSLGAALGHEHWSYADAEQAAESIRVVVAAGDWPEATSLASDVARYILRTQPLGYLGAPELHQLAWAVVFPAHVASAKFELDDELSAGQRRELVRAVRNHKASFAGGFARAYLDG